jgi:two-component system osmolarity sensor histidine kinase EnvZ
MSALRQSRLALPLFWRTYGYIAVLLGVGLIAWVQTIHALDAKPRAAQSAAHLAALVAMARNQLGCIPGITRQAAGAVERSFPGPCPLNRQTGKDRWVSFETDSRTRAVASQLRERLGPSVVLASDVNGMGGLWVGFHANNIGYWLRALSADDLRDPPLGLGTWLWVTLALLTTLLGAAFIAIRINKPIRELSFAASRIEEGEYDSRLDENIYTSEIRQVNMGFNRMARELAKVEEDRAVMLAGISHDLRTPLARLRLEAEMSVQDEEAKRFMAMDIDQLDAIIDKFMDYARPGEVKLSPVHLAALVEREAAAFRDPSQIRVSSWVTRGLWVQADETELARVLQNLFENARRYGRSSDTGVARVSVSELISTNWVRLTVRDFGPGVPADKLDQLTTPFYRGDAARTAATGAGLGLAIVEKAVQRMGGRFELDNAPEGTGLVAYVSLKRAEPPAPEANLKPR